MLVRLAVSVVGDSGVVGMEVSRLFRSFGSSGADNPASEQHAALIDEAAELGLGPVRGKYRARHAQPEDDVDDSPPVHEAIEPSPAVAMVEAADEWAVDEWDGPDDFRFVVRPEPFMTPATHGSFAMAEEYGVEDPRIAHLEGRYYITYSAYSQHGVRIGESNALRGQKIQSRGGNL